MTLTCLHEGQDKLDSLPLFRCDSSISTGASLRQLDHQRRFLPQQIYTLLVPLLARFAKLHVEIPEHPRKNAAHLGVCEAGGQGLSRKTAVGHWRFGSPLSNAVPWTEGKRLTSASLVVCIDLIAKPAFWYEIFGVAEVFFG